MSNRTWNRSRRSGNGAGDHQPRGERSDRGGGGQQSNGRRREDGVNQQGTGGGNNNNNNNASASAKKAKPTSHPLTRSDLRRLLHDKLEWQSGAAAELNFTLLVCADEPEPAEAELIVISSGVVASLTRYVRSDIVEAQLKADKQQTGEDDGGKSEEVKGETLPETRDDETSKDQTSTGCRDASFFRFDPSSKTHKCKVLNLIARALHAAWCGLLFVPAYQVRQATAFIRALNPKSEVTYVESYVKRLVCLEDLLWTLRSARGFGEVEPPLAVRVWESMREEDMAQLREYADLTCDCLLATIHEGATPVPQLPEGLLSSHEGTTYHTVSGSPQSLLSKEFTGLTVYEPSSRLGSQLFSASTRHHYPPNVNEDTVRWLEALEPPSSMDTPGIVEYSTM